MTELLPINELLVNSTGFNFCKQHQRKFEIIPTPIEFWNFIIELPTLINRSKYRQVFRSKNTIRYDKNYYLWKIYSRNN